MKTVLFSSLLKFGVAACYLASIAYGNSLYVLSNTINLICLPITAVMTFLFVAAYFALTTGKNAEIKSYAKSLSEIKPSIYILSGIQWALDVYVLFCLISHGFVWSTGILFVVIILSAITDITIFKTKDYVKNSRFFYEKTEKPRIHKDYI